MTIETLTEEERAELHEWADDAAWETLQKMLRIIDQFTTALTEAQTEVERLDNIYSRLVLFLGTLDKYAPRMLGGSGQYGGMAKTEEGAWIRAEDIDAHLSGQPAAPDPLNYELVSEATGMPALTNRCTVQPDRVYGGEGLPDVEVETVIPTPELDPVLDKMLELQTRLESMKPAAPDPRDAEIARLKRTLTDMNRPLDNHERQRSYDLEVEVARLKEALENAEHSIRLNVERANGYRDAVEAEKAIISEPIARG